jgi:uncharacterized membrane protein YkvA (DUF1232 family)
MGTGTETFNPQKMQVLWDDPSGLRRLVLYGNVSAQTVRLLWQRRYSKTDEWVVPLMVEYAAIELPKDRIPDVVFALTELAPALLWTPASL